MAKITGDCKGCSATVHVDEAQIQHMLNKLEASKGFSFVEENVYQERLNHCQSCASFAYGTTCLHCGCIMQIKAKLLDAKCPYPGASKW